MMQYLGSVVHFWPFKQNSLFPALAYVKCWAQTWSIMDYWSSHCLYPLGKGEYIFEQYEEEDLEWTEEESDDGDDDADEDSIQKKKIS